MDNPPRVGVKGSNVKYLLLALLCLLPGAAGAQEQPAKKYLLIVPDSENPWAAPQLGAALDEPEVSYFEGSLLQAFNFARTGLATGVLEIKLDTSSAFESGRVVCYAPNGKKVWEEKVFVNFGFGAERIARMFAEKLEKKVKGKRCP
jgi:hypothetical protein